VLSRKKASYDDSSYQYRLLTLKAFSSDSIYPAEKGLDEFFAAREIKEKYMVQVFDIVVRLRAPSRALYMDASCAGLLVSSLMVIVRVHCEAIERKFLAYALNASMAQRTLEREQKGTTIMMVQTADIEELEIPLPTFEKQKSFVSLMELAERETALLERLKEEKIRYSHALLDKIISQEKETR